MIGVEQLFGAIYRQLLDLIDELTTAVIAFPWNPLRPYCW